VASLERFEDDDGLVGYRSPALAELGVPHLFTTRRGPGGRDLDAGAIDDEGRLARAAGIPGARLERVRQIHGDAVRVVEPRDPDGVLVDADALVTSAPGRLLLVRVADCVPVLVARADGRRVAAIHAGWRGLVAGVIPRALEALGSGPHVAAVGPCLSRARFEVGPEVAAAFEEAGLVAAVHPGPAEKPHVDLRRAARLLLEERGVERIDETDLCTWEREDELYSYRRDVTHGGAATTGRTAALVGGA
jgi:YfiH family protein